MLVKGATGRFSSSDELKACISSYIPEIIMVIITYPCTYQSPSGGPGSILQDILCPGPISTGEGQQRTERQAWATYQIHKIECCTCTRNCGSVLPATDFKGIRKLAIPACHHDTRVTHVPWCMSGSLTHGGGENVPGIPGACATFNFTYLARGPWYNTVNPV